MSEQAVHRISQELGISYEQANAVWLKVRKAMFGALLEGMPVDLGFAYLLPTIRAPRQRHHLKSGQTITMPTLHTLKMLVPPHVQDALGGKAALSPYVFMTRPQLKNLPRAELDELERQRLSFYRLKGVSS